MKDSKDVVAVVAFGVRRSAFDVRREPASRLIVRWRGAPEMQQMLFSGAAQHPAQPPVKAFKT